jgi:hypothetical protein
MEQAHSGGVVQEQAEVQEWVDLAGEGWEDREPVRALRENASVLSVGLRFPMRSGFPVTTKTVQNVVQRWCEDNSQF